jgi:quinol monooxygenase YgiN
MSEIVVIAHMRAQPGKEDELKTALTGLIEPSHSDQGCILYTLHQGVDDPSRFAFVERWASREDLEAHNGTAHVGALLEQAPALLAEAPDIAVFDALPAGDASKGSLAGASA